MIDKNIFSTTYSIKDIKVDKQVTVFSCFSCCGGSTIGYKRAGFNVVGNVEIDKSINEIYVKNNNPKYTFNMDIRDFLNQENLPNELLSLDILDGSPPCTTFSSLGEKENSLGKIKKFHEGQKEQRLDDLFFYFIKVVEKLHPKVMVAENVAGMLNNRHYLIEIKNRLSSIGYSLQVFKLNAKYMDVPMQRERLFFIANRMKYKPLSMNFNHKLITYSQIEDKQSQREFLKPGTKIYDLIKNNKQNESLCDTHKRMFGKRSYFSSYIVRPDKPINCFDTTLAIYRRDFGKLTNLEIAKGASFPIDFDFMGKIKVAVGMCVPPNMMANVANQLWEQWFKKEKENEQI